MSILIRPSPMKPNCLWFSFLLKTVTPAPRRCQMLASSPKYSWSSA